MRKTLSPITRKHIITMQDVVAFYKRNNYTVESYHRAHELIELAVRLPSCNFKNMALRDITQWIRLGDEQGHYVRMKQLLYYYVQSGERPSGCEEIDDALQLTDAILMTEGALLAEKSKRSWAQSIWGVAKAGVALTVGAVKFSVPWIGLALSIGYRLVSWGICSMQRLASTYLLNIGNYLLGSPDSLQSNFLFHVAALLCEKQGEWDSLRNKSTWDKFTYLTRTDRSAEEWKKDAAHVFKIKTTYKGWKEAEAEAERIRKGIPPEEKGFWGGLTKGAMTGIEAAGYLAMQTQGWYDTSPDIVKNVVGKGATLASSYLGPVGGAVGTVFQYGQQ